MQTLLAASDFYCIRSDVSALAYVQDFAEGASGQNECTVQLWLFNLYIPCTLEQDARFDKNERDCACVPCA